MFCCAHGIPHKPPEGKEACSHIIFPNLNEGTISNAEVTDCDKNVLCRQRHERVAIMYRCGASVHSGDALTSLA